MSAYITKESAEEALNKQREIDEARRKRAEQLVNIAAENNRKTNYIINQQKEV